MPMQTLAMFFLVALAAGGRRSGCSSIRSSRASGKAEQRQESVVRSEPAARARPRPRGPKVRREQIEETLKELEVRQKKQKNLPLAMRISQAGLELDASASTSSSASAIGVGAVRR